MGTKAAHKLLVKLSKGVEEKKEHLTECVTSQLL